MTEKVFASGVKRESGWLYYLDSRCNIARSRTRKSEDRPNAVRPELVVRTDLAEKDPRFHYFIDNDGDLARKRLKHAPPASKNEDAPKTSIYRKRALVQHTRRPRFKK